MHFTRVMAFVAAMGAVGSVQAVSLADLKDPEDGRFDTLVARALGLHAGVDVARGPEDTAVYITVGSYWR